VPISPAHLNRIDMDSGAHIPFYSIGIGVFSGKSDWPRLVSRLIISRTVLLFPLHHGTDRNSCTLTLSGKPLSSGL